MGNSENSTSKFILVFIHHNDAFVMITHISSRVVMSNFVITPVGTGFQHWLTDVCELNFCNMKIDKMAEKEPMMDEDIKSTYLLLTSTVIPKLWCQVDTIASSSQCIQAFCSNLHSWAQSVHNSTCILVRFSMKKGSFGLFQFWVISWIITLNAFSISWTSMNGGWSNSALFLSHKLPPFRW